jgi:iron-sulfur cluster repair protein YtfE (RIC family)
MSSTTAPTPTDTRIMGLIHTIYRREFRLAGEAIRGVDPGDTARAAVVSDHLELLHDNLHHHHSAEDDLLWPKLLERVPDELAPLVHLMEQQHATVEALLEEISEVLPRWRSSAGLSDRDALADLHDRLYLHLVEHMDAEEERLLPIASRNVTQEEWEEMGARARSGTPRSQSLLVLGMITYDGDPSLVELMLSDAPAPVRWLLPRIAGRKYRRHARAVYGTPTP